MLSVNGVESILIFRHFDFGEKTSDRRKATFIEKIPWWTLVVFGMRCHTRLRNVDLGKACKVGPKAQAAAKTSQ